VAVTHQVQLPERFARIGRTVADAIWGVKLRPEGGFR
jgi:hypothetical protein